MKRVLLGLMAVVALASGGCTCSLETAMVEQLERNHSHIFPAYLKYVEKDSSLSAEDKKDEQAVVESAERLLGKLKERAKE